jgi:hypothetical protein
MWLRKGQVRNNDIRSTKVNTFIKFVRSDHFYEPRQLHVIYENIIPKLRKDKKVGGGNKPSLQMCCGVLCCSETKVAAHPNNDQKPGKTYAAKCCNEAAAAVTDDGAHSKPGRRALPGAATYLMLL